MSYNVLYDRQWSNLCRFITVTEISPQFRAMAASDWGLGFPVIFLIFNPNLEQSNCNGNHYPQDQQSNLKLTPGHLHLYFIIELLSNR